MLNKFAGSFIVYGLASGLSRSILILLVPLYTAVFTPADFGVVDLISGAVALMVVICMLQLESAIARYYYESDDQQRIVLISTGFWTVALFTIILSTLVLLMSEFVSTNLLHSDQMASLLPLIAVQVLCSVIFNFLVFLIRYEKRPGLYFVIIMTQIAVTVAAIFWFIYYQSLGVKGVIYGQMLGFAVPIPYLIYHFRRYVAFHWSKSVTRQLLSYALPLIPSVAINWGSAYMSRFLMISSLSIAQIGLYSLAVRIASGFSMIEMAFTLTWSPFFWDTFAQKTKVQLYHTIFRLTAIMMFSLVAIGSLVGKEIIALMANVQYAEAGGILGIVFLSYSLPIFLQIVGMGPAITKKTYYNALVSVAGLVLSLLLLYAIINQTGIFGMALASLAGNVVTLAMLWFISAKLYPLGFSFWFFAGLMAMATMVVAATYLYDMPASLRFAGALVVIATSAGFVIANGRKFKTDWSAS